jgi:hypothetical protein
MPRIFIISSHGCMSMQESACSLPVMGKLKVKNVVKISSPIDIFTTTGFGCEFVSDLSCDQPFVDVIQELAHNRDTIQAQSSKAQLRQFIKDTLVHVRALPQHRDVMTISENKIRCHKKGRPMTELLLFEPAPGMPVFESVTMFDTVTGEIQDVHKEFGLRTKKTVDVVHTGCSHEPEKVKMLQSAKMKAESELASLRTRTANPRLVDMKIGRIQSIDDTIACVHKGSKFEYAPKMKKVYKDRIKLSDLMHIGISTGLVNPETDFLIIYACRVPYDRMLCSETSPRDSSDSERSVGGSQHKTRRKRQRQQQQQQRYTSGKKYTRKRYSY